MASLLYTVLLSLVVTTAAKVPNASKFLGVGYNLLRGNPDGRESDSLGGVDPGLLVTRRILDITNPQSTVYVDRDSNVKTTNVYYGEKSYQKTLMNSVDAKIGGGLSSLLSSFSFTLSRRSAKARNETNVERNVFFEKRTVTNQGRIRYATELVGTKHFPVTPNFAAAVCSLPHTYNEKAYMTFIEQWGTHVTVQVDYGQRTIDRYSSSLIQFLNQAQKQSGTGVTVGGAYDGFSGSLGMDFGKFEKSSSSGSQFGSHKYTLKAGQHLPEPISITIATLDTVLTSDYWQDTALCPGVNILSSLSATQKNIQTALQGYPKYTLAHKPSDQALRIPITWPKGTYGLLQAKSGCPSAHVTWHTGYRREDMQDVNNRNSWSSNNHFAGVFNKDIEIHFCMKRDAVATRFDRDWFPGTYCIYKSGTCPKGFHEGSIEMNDEDVTNHGSSGGAKPDGNYGRNTKIYYCCRTDGPQSHPIALPSDKPFYLMMKGSQCQQVYGTRVNREYITYDTVSFIYPNVKTSGNIPSMTTGRDRSQTVNYCYYQRDPKATLIG